MRLGRTRANIRFCFLVNNVKGGVCLPLIRPVLHPYVLQRYDYEKGLAHLARELLRWTEDWEGYRDVVAGIVHRTRSLNALDDWTGPRFFERSVH